MPDTMNELAGIREKLKLDDLNFAYFSSLLERMFAAKGLGATKPLRIFDAGVPGAAEDPSKLLAYPTEIAPPEMRSQLKSVDYDALRKQSDYAEAARTAAFWPKKMQAGTGSSMTRRSYVARIRGTPEEQVRIGAKGTDLFVRLPGSTRMASLAEIQILQAIRDHRAGLIGELVFQDVVSSETAESIEAIWKLPCLDDPSKTYDEIVRATPGLSRFERTFQSHLPTLDENLKISFNRLAPGGHALFFLDAIRAAYREELRPPTKGPLVSAISNGEDLSATPDAAMIGWMVRERVPLALVMTAKTPIDVKGGTLSFVKEEDGFVRMTVLETAQAKEEGQQALFERLGGWLNTNMALINYAELAPRITKLVAEIGEDELMKIVAPDLIQNWKKQKDSDGVERRYLQLEGAMGSSIMNLDRYWRKRFGEPLCHFVMVSEERRTDFFSPIKSAFDFFMQFESDRFELDPVSLRLKNRRPGKLPLVTLKDPAYTDVQTVLDDFSGASILDLDELEVEGRKSFASQRLSGRVSSKR